MISDDHEGIKAAVSSELPGVDWQRCELAEQTPHQRRWFLGAKTTFKAPTSRRGARWLVNQAEDLTGEQQAFVEQLCRLCPTAREMQQVAGECRRIVRERQPEALDALLDAAARSEVAELEGFAGGLNKGYEADQSGALNYEWSSGQVEGQINRLKLIKRQMYGRANFDLLKARLLHAA